MGYLIEIVAGSAAPAAAGVTVIGGADAPLMSGLIESRAHLGLADIAAPELTRRPREEHMLVTVRKARIMLAAGHG